MQQTKRRSRKGVVLLALAIALLVVAIVPAAAMAATDMVQVNGGAAYIGSTTVDLTYSSADIAAVQVSFSARLNGGAWATESTREAYVTGTTAAKNNWVLPVTPTSVGDVVDVRATFYNGSSVPVGAAPVATVTYDNSRLYSYVDFWWYGYYGNYGVYWFGPWADTVYGDTWTSNDATTKSVQYKIDGTTSGQIYPWTGELFYNYGSASSYTDGLHTLQHWAVNNADIAGPAYTDTFGVDYEAPHWTVTGADSGIWYGKADVKFTADVRDDGGSGVWSAYVNSSDFPITATFNQFPWDPYSYRCTDGTISYPATSQSGTVDLQAYDMVGNYADKYLNLKFDVAAPSTVVSMVPDASDYTKWTNKPVTVTFTANDADSGVAYTEYIIGDYKTTYPAPSTVGTQAKSVVIDKAAAEGPVYLYYRSVDKAQPANKEPYQLAMVFFDNIAPTITDNYPGWWMNTDFVVHTKATDANSGIATPGLQYEVGTWHPAIAAGGVEDWVHFYLGTGLGELTDGIYPFKYWATDNATNKSENTINLKVDTRAPVTDGDAGWINGTKPYVLTATDQAPGSGVAATLYRVDQQTPFTANVAATPAATLVTEIPVFASATQGAVHTIDFASVDDARPADWVTADGIHYGNWELNATASVTNEKWSVTPYKTRSVKLDITAPVATVTGNDDQWHSSAVTLQFAATDVGAGVDYIESSIDGTTWTKGNSIQVSKNGETTVSYRAVDKVGLVGATQTVTVKVSTTAPTVAASNATVKSGKRAAIGINITAVTPAAKVVVEIRTKSGKTVAKYYYTNVVTNTDTTVTPLIKLKKGSYLIRVGATDQAGNAQSKLGTAKLTVK